MAAIVFHSSQLLFTPLHRHALASPDYTAEQCLGPLIRYCDVLVADSQAELALTVCEQTLEALQSRADFAIRQRLQLLGRMALVAEQAGHIERARALLERASAIAGESPLADRRLAGVLYHNLASHYLQQRRVQCYDEAERLLEQATAIVAAHSPRASSGYAGVRAQLASLLAAKGDPERAGELYLPGGVSVV